MSTLRFGAEFVGTDYTLSVDDSVTATDAQTFDSGLALADSVTPADAQAFDVALALDDAVSATDSLTSESEGVVTLGDSVTATDDAATETGYERSVDDSVTADDDQTSELGVEHLLSVDDSVTVTDDLTSELGAEAPPEEGLGGWVPLRRAHRLEVHDLVLASDRYELEAFQDPEAQHEEELVLALV